MLYSSGRPGKEYGYLKIGQKCVSIPALPLISCVTPSSLRSLSKLYYFTYKMALSLIFMPVTMTGMMHIQVIPTVCRVSKPLFSSQGA